ncbi:hypothetical protein GCM10010922_25670 [Microbacterium sorbitolivorans]|uniref:ATPase BadF/BadG/BcrA/BcrD type domain-containing protein n=1 Tax=Microbacterium sorbitolivorans TaxID=1867410 RepID=A0A367Y2T6_9MICO|nr:BadF/BadG/BcrA/BcrD ATPase family protein [Microbacterium sorbitolivorans]RCK60193.1 hypothetical protein DTO57_08725 [Microbacterium sorbitolivorans]GGF48699.1 hypothetical protein GCM10010922_25670 [Microbacterium sorbitolivorans]
MSAGLRLAIDAGQTGIKARGAGAADRLFPGVRTHEPLIPQLVAVVEALAGDDPIDSLSFGVSGLTSAEADAAALLAALPGSRPRRILLAHDSITSYLGALGDRTGAVIASGTGAVALAVGATRIARVDGWGNIMGDAGSAYWIGREALDAVMRAHDGRGPATALVGVVRERWPDLEDAYIDLQSDPNRVSVVASLAAAVDAHAGTDEVAARIAWRAGAELAASVIAGLARVDGGSGAGVGPASGSGAGLSAGHGAADLDRASEPTSGSGAARSGAAAPSRGERAGSGVAGRGTSAGSADEPVAAIGGVFRSELIRGSFERALAHGRPSARVVAADGDGLDGAERLAELPSGHALHAGASIAVSGS